jgi:hypothetical protein
MTLPGMRGQLRAQFAVSVSTALVALAMLASSVVALEGETQIELQPDT